MTRLDISLGLVSDFHQKLGLRVYHMLQDAFVDAITTHKQRRHQSTNDLCTHTAPKLSELDTNKYSFPSESSWSNTPECNSELYKSPWPGGYQFFLSSSALFGHGNNVSL